MPNVYFLQGAPATDEQMAQKTSIQGALYLSNDVSGNSNSNRLYIGRTNTAGGIKPIVTPTPFKQIIQFNGATKSSFDGTADVTTNIQAVSLVSSTNNALVRFDGTKGFIKNSNVTLDDSGNINTSGNITAQTFIGSLNGNADTASKLTTSAGSATQPIYFSDGVPVASTATVGENTADAAKPIFMNAGTLTALSVSSGTAERPTYLNAGVITPTTYRMVATNTIATTAKTITEDLPTGIWYVNGTADIFGQADGVCIVSKYSSNWISEIYQDYISSRLAIRSKDKGIWKPWLRILDSSISFQANLDSTTAGTLSSLTETSISLGVTGTLPITNGGTGATTPENVLINLGVTATAAELNILDGATITINGNTITGSLNGNAVSATNATNSSKLYVNTTSADTNYYILGATGTGNQSVYRALNSSGTANTTGVYFNGVTGVLFGAAWNDYAEFRQSNELEAGRVVCETGKGNLVLSTERLQPGAEIISDTFGFAIGETDKCKTPIAASGRVLAYTFENRYEFKAGDAVCAAPGGTISKMTREEIINYPDRIIGTVSEIPEYATWGQNNIKVNDRIWIRIR